MVRRFAYQTLAVFFVSLLVTPVLLTASPVAASTTSLPAPAGGIPHWMAFAGLVFFAGSLAVTLWLLRDRYRDPDLSRRGDPWNDGTVDDRTVIEALTDPDLPPVGYERPEPATVFGPEPLDEDTAILNGFVVDDTDWTTAMTVPAPPIVAEPTTLAEDWIAAWERGETPDLAAWSDRMLEGSK